MKPARFLVVAVCAVLTAGCAMSRDDGGKGREGAFVHFTLARPRVAVLSIGDEPTIVVDQEPVVIKQSDNLEALTTIEWSLDPAGPYAVSKYENRFPGIQFLSPRLNAACQRVADDPKKYVCVYRKAPKVKVPYQITVTISDSGNERDYVRSDPSVMNN